MIEPDFDERDIEDTLMHDLPTGDESMPLTKESRVLASETVDTQHQNSQTASTAKSKPRKRNEHS